jgi:hypothetical protein
VAMEQAEFERHEDWEESVGRLQMEQEAAVQ